MSGEAGQAQNAAGDVIQISYSGGQSLGGLSYSYDLDGRRHGVWDTQARVALPAATTSNAVYDAGNRLTSWNGASLTYDNAGNLTQDGSQTFAWNARGQLTGTSAGNSTFAYDAFGRRYSATVSGSTRGFLYDGWNAVQEKDGVGAVSANSIFGPDLDAVFWRKPVASPASSYLTDALGSTIALTDASGASTTSYTYEPFGRPTSGDLGNPFAFTGREWDSTVGIQLNRMRYYSPLRGRFLSEDPIGEAGGLNLYGYAGTAPTLFTDAMAFDPKSEEVEEIPPILEARLRNDEGFEACGPSVSVRLIAILSMCTGSAGDERLGIGVGITAGVQWTTFEHPGAHHVQAQGPTLCVIACLGYSHTVYYQDGQVIDDDSGWGWQGWGLGITLFSSSGDFF